MRARAPTAWKQIAEVFRSKTRDEWRAFNDERDAMIEPVLDLDEALESDLFREREMVVEVEQPGVGPVRLLGHAGQVLAHGRRRDPAAPALGEHTERGAGATPGSTATSRCSIPAPSPGWAKNATGSFMS